MTGIHGQVAFVIWRESLEAPLVVGILHVWLTHHAGAKATATGRRFLWGGVVAGLASASLLAVVILSFSSRGAFPGSSSSTLPRYFCSRWLRRW